MKELIKRLPLVGPLALALKHWLFPTAGFTTSADYWVSRYRAGGNSGAGSYHRLAAFKAEVLNAFVAEHGIASVLELGCGDGNQLAYFRFPTYRGFDISDDALNQCRAAFRHDPTKQFLPMPAAPGHTAELALSLDVLYHLIEDDIYQRYLRQLFAAATRYVIIYAADTDEARNYAPHVKPRKFTTWVARYEPAFQLIAHIPNRFPFEEGRNDSTSFADFYVYQRHA